jgi:hypothetical protein
MKPPGDYLSPMLLGILLILSDFWTLPLILGIALVTNIAVQYFPPQTPTSTPVKSK